MSHLIHSVHFYDHDEALIARLQNIVVSSLKSGSSVLIVATVEHRTQLDTAIGVAGSKIKKLAKERLQMLDAKETLAKFMVNGRPSEKRFRESVGKLITDPSLAANNEQRRITVFGEMVAVLWTEGNKVAALELERLWNDLLHAGSFHLHCAYPRRILQEGSDKFLIKAVCDEHSSVLGHAAHLKRTPPQVSAA